MEVSKLFREFHVEGVCMSVHFMCQQNSYIYVRIYLKLSGKKQNKWNIRCVPKWREGNVCECGIFISTLLCHNQKQKMQQSFTHWPSANHQIWTKLAIFIPCEESISYSTPTKPTWPNPWVATIHHPTHTFSLSISIPIFMLGYGRKYVNLSLSVECMLNSFIIKASNSECSTEIITQRSAERICALVTNRIFLVHKVRASNECMVFI